MTPKSIRRALLALAGIMPVALGLSSCSKDGTSILIPNRPPTVELTNAPVAADRSNPYFYAYRVNWSGDDPDGRIDHYEFAVDPTPTDTVWNRTTKNEEVVFFRASQADPANGLNPRTASDFHVFVIKALDDDGARSPHKSRAFFSYTIAPTVAILNPIPTPLLRAQISPSVRIDWTGGDADGQFSQKPVQYKYKLLDLSDPGNLIFLTRPDSLRIQEVATNWAGWDSTSADTQFVQFTDLTPQKSYMFVIIGFDEAGAYSPIFDLNTNCLQMTVGFASSNGPRIGIFCPYISFVYASGGYSIDPLRWINVEIPSHVPVPVGWIAIPSPGSRIQSFRWMVDGNVNDQTERSDEANDYIHWSRPSPTMPDGVFLRGFDDGDHFFYLECLDNNTQKSLGILHMTVVTPTFDKELLVVRDTRLEVDKFPSGLLANYTQPWPASTELDTFLYARGGFPWRSTKNPTSGVISQPGLFSGYVFDTLGTRQGLENPVHGVLLSKIGGYKRLVWLVDDRGALFIESDNQLIQPMTALHAMSGPGRASSLAAYTQLGGQVWLAGGGAAFTSLRHYDRVANNAGQTTVFSSAAQFGELVSGRIMFDAAHWQSTIAVTKSTIHTYRYDNTTVSPPIIVASEWSHAALHSRDDSGAVLRRPDYSKLPAKMRWRQDAGDPLPPTRTAGQSGLFYSGSFPCEYLKDGNSIFEDVNPDPELVSERSVLDTLFEAKGAVLLTSLAPTMTYYHGASARQFVFSGFAPWGFARQDCIQLIDFVLQDLWGMPRASVDRGSFAPALRSRGSSPARSVTPVKHTLSARVPTGTTRE